jgi:hypothetical protein
MRNRNHVLTALALAVALSGCAGPVALQVVSFAADGAAYASTGKGTTDHALSAMAGEDCRLANVLRGRSVCVPRKPKVNLGTDDTIALAFAPSDVTAPAAGPVPSSAPRVSMIESAGMNMAEIHGAPSDAVLRGRVDGKGTLHVAMMGAAGTESVLFSVPGYRRNPGAFTGVMIGSRFIAPESLLR